VAPSKLGVWTTSDVLQVVWGRNKEKRGKRVGAKDPPSRIRVDRRDVFTHNNTHIHG